MRSTPPVKVDFKGKTVAIFGLGPIGMFLALIVKGLGASAIIGIEPNPVAAEMAKKLGIDYVIPLGHVTHNTQHAANKILMPMTSRLRMKS